MIILSECCHHELCSKPGAKANFKGKSIGNVYICGKCFDFCEVYKYYNQLEVDAMLLELLEYAVPKGKKPRTRGEVLVKYAKMVIREGMTECKDAQHIKKILD